MSETKTSFSKSRHNLNGKTKIKQIQSSDGVNSSYDDWSGDSRVTCRRIKPV